ncbi:hypothetical protein [Rheinheimera texasensis]|uniref:hypothetical protein n=1 Tax=Rheinheimera texasensis TaxID=306205 RepID=UPI0012FEB646|nr:hypothetical protein [Rheinheimera texasensis]
MNENQWRNQALRRKVGHTSEQVYYASNSVGTVYSSPNTVRLYLSLSDKDEAPKKMTGMKTKIVTK